MGIPSYPEDWATRFAEIDRRLGELAAAAASRVAFTGGTLTEALTVNGLLTASGGLTAPDLAATDDLTVGDDLAVGGDATIGGGLGVTGAMTAGSAAVAGALTAGTATVGGTSLALFLNPPYGTAVKGSNQSIANTTYTGVSGCTYTASADGYYALTGTSWWDNDPDGRREAAFRIQGGGALYVCDSRHSNANTPLMNSLAALIPMTNGQTVELAVWHSAGNALNVLTGSRLEAIWRRPL